MDPHVDRFNRALAIYRTHPAEWSMLYGVLLLVAICTAGLGCILLPSAIRLTRDAIREDRAPEPLKLFEFDTKTLPEDAIAAGALLVITMIAGSFTGPLATLAGIAFGVTPNIVTEDDVGGIDALSLSLAFLQKEPAPVFIHGFLATLVNLPGACCLFPLVVTIPISSIAYWLFYEDYRSNILPG